MTPINGLTLPTLRPDILDMSALPNVHRTTKLSESQDRLMEGMVGLEVRELDTRLLWICQRVIAHARPLSMLVEFSNRLPISAAAPTTNSRSNVLGESTCKLMSACLSLRLGLSHSGQSSTG